jgi:Cu-Zn family superoxide dismutase
MEVEMAPSWLLMGFLMTSAFSVGQLASTGAGGAKAKAELRNPSGQVVGSAVLTDTPNGVLIRASFQGLPAGTHAMHLHAVGRCEPPTFESAGGHFNPAQQQHGYLDPSGPHAGDLPNIHATATSFSVEAFAPRLRLQAGKTALLDSDGAALVIHAGADDYQTEPAGDAGTRIACGALTIGA